jgi:hypothetical protein
VDLASQKAYSQSANGVEIQVTQGCLFLASCLGAGDQMEGLIPASSSSRIGTKTSPSDLLEAV